MGLRTSASAGVRCALLQRALCPASPLAPRLPATPAPVPLDGTQCKPLICKTGKVPESLALQKGLEFTPPTPFHAVVRFAQLHSPLDIVYLPSPRPCGSPPSSALPRSFSVHVALSTGPGVRRPVTKILLL